MHRLTHPINHFEGTTAHEPRPSRQLKQYRYLDEGTLTRLQDEWDASEAARQHLEIEGRRIDEDIERRRVEAERAETERSDAVIDGELRRRFLAGGGTADQFAKERAELRLAYARKVALGEAEALNATSILQEQLRAIRADMNLRSPEAV